MARILNHVNVGVGIILWLCFVIYIILVVTAITNIRYNSNYRPYGP